MERRFLSAFPVISIRGAYDAFNPMEFSPMNIDDQFRNMRPISDGWNSANRNDIASFISLMGGGSASNVSLGASNQFKAIRATAAEAERQVVAATQEKIRKYANTQTNAMLLESRGSAVKKTTEIAKEIGF